MSDRPILFSAPMVRPIIREAEAAGTGKTQTRRILKPQPPEGARYSGTHYASDEPASWFFNSPHGPCKVRQRFEEGDRLWVRETWRTNQTLNLLSPAQIDNLLKGHQIRCPIRYEADALHIDGDNVQKWGKTRVSIHMPRWASRLTLTVTEVRVQRLQEISETDCLKEGPPSVDWRAGQGGWVVPCEGQPHISMAPRTWYRGLWDKINGAGSWDRNPWVVAITFKPALRNIDAAEEP